MKNGFTLLELLLVLVILSVAMAVVGPAIGNRLTSSDPRRTIRQLRATMELLRVRAIQGGKEEVLVIAPHQNTYWSERDGRIVTVPPEGGELSARGRWVRPEGEVEFRFYPDGTNSGGEVWVAQRRGVTVTAYVLSLDPLLGTVTISLAKE
ncbi:MAG: prepilin-type N-terminal cleavage/methylation domain-containing protein [Candidatus Binatia bacterium]|nr:prepilin-type N-terminal cleavage/methylation domain-containing protein [Candidatus Binatia bacterium]